MQLVLFYIFAAVMLSAATMVITARNPVHSALFLVLVFFNAAVLWLMAGAEFLGIALVLVYVGAVMVLFLFVVMMLDINLAPLREGFIRYLPIGAAVAIAMAFEMVAVVTSGNFHLGVGAPGTGPADVNNTKALGTLLYTVYAYPFELAAAVLLVAIIAAILLTLRRRPDTKHQTPGRQVRVRKEDRLRIVRVETEKRG
ncbi:MAG TPA: NADH-quinone oxidoreductase subunit J [Pseudomonadales bacterium]|nr:NADH-quinone oxidoreductase subunit J [Pseudomonadales bacterium]